MKIIKNYNNYVSDLLLESIKDGKDLNFSKEFLSLLDKIDHPISTKLKNSHEKLNDNSTTIELESGGVDKISWKEPGRNKTKTKIGKFITKLFGEQRGTEDFVNKFKSLREGYNFDIVTGSDIERYYDNTNYAEPDSGMLGKSDMSYASSKNFIKFYSKNSNKNYKLGAVSLVVLLDDDDKVLGRALLWKLSKPSNRWFMDRVYTSKPHLIELFIDYAKENGWLYLEKQSLSSVKICDSKTGECGYMDLVVSNVKKHTDYPYMDTIKYFFVDEGELKNEIDDKDKDEKIYLLNSTEGDYQDLQEVEEDNEIDDNDE